MDHIRVATQAVRAGEPVVLRPLFGSTASGAAWSGSGIDIAVMIEDAVAEDDVWDRLAPPTCRDGAFVQCAGEAQVYWHGSHASRLDALVTGVRAAVCADADAGPAPARCDRTNR